MKILIIGAGGREHALAWALESDERVKAITLVGVTAVKTEKINSIQLNLDEIVSFVESHQIDLTIVGPEQPLSEGIVDRLQAIHHPVFGPHQKSAQLESSKDFAKQFMTQYQIPTAQFKTFDTYQAALDNLGLFGYPEVIKADGLCGGKGVYICHTKQDSRAALNEIFIDKVFNDQGSKVVIEQYLEGFEASLLCFVSNHKIIPFETAMDYKKIYEGDLGPNTGGVGCLSPNPYWTERHQQQSNQIIKKIEKGLAEQNLGYAGILFIGYLVDHDRVYVLEFNTRFGDPETEVLLPRMKSNLLDHILACLKHEEFEIQFEEQQALCVILTSKGYPKDYEKGKLITGIQNINDSIVYLNGTILKDNQIYSHSGRVLSVVALAPTLEEARRKVYSNIKQIKFENMTYRQDIGQLK